nr:hypothetical protein [Achromobacter ruhlandii]
MPTQKDPLQNIIDQMANLLLALTKGQADKDPTLTKGLLGYAIEASKLDGGSAEMLIQVYEKTFPGAPLPIALSEADFNELAKKVT